MWHQSELILADGDTISPGRWGATILATGESHPFFFREQFLELWRVSHTQVQVSRLACSFAFEDRRAAIAWAEDDSSHCYEVEPVDPEALSARVDMLWLTWMGEPNATFERTEAQCRRYWEGHSTGDLSPHAQPQWEWLFSCALRVLRQVH